jgi:hypothetical protein
MAESIEDGAGGTKNRDPEPAGASSESEYVRPFPWVASVALAALFGTTAVLWVADPGSGGTTGGSEDAGASARNDAGGDTDTDGSSPLRLGSIQAVDLSGIWAEKTVQTSVTDVPVVGQVEGRTITHRRLEVDQRGDTVDLRSTLCGTSVESNSNAVQTVIPDAYI